MVPWYDTTIGLSNPPASPTLGTFVALPNETNFSFGGFTWTPYFKTSAADYAVQKDEFNNFRFEVRSGDIADADVVSGNSGTERAEINHGGSLDLTKIIVIDFLQMVPSGTPINGRNLFALGQLHQIYDAGDADGTAPLLMHCYDYAQVLCRGATAKPTVANPPIVDAYFGAAPARDVWASYKWRFKYATDGFVQVFRNGVLIVDYTGPFGYNNANGPSPQFGIYRGTSSETTVVYYSAISIGYE